MCGVFADRVVIAMDYDDVGEEDFDPDEMLLSPDDMMLEYEDYDQDYFVGETHELHRRLQTY